MKKTPFLIPFSIILLTLVLFSASCQKKASNDNSFSFVFMTDIHLQPELNAVQGFRQALDTIVTMNPDFIITGGDLIMDALGVSHERADSLYNLYLEVTNDYDIPFYNTMGNHEIYGMYIKEEGIENNPDYGEKMFENKIGKSYQSFTHKGWKFMILNSVEEKANKKYTGLIDDAQIEWIKKELSNTDKNIPIVISTHIPLITAFKHRSHGSTVPIDSSGVVYNSKEVLDLFNDYNLKLVLQGHLHIIEDILINGTHFITGGAVSSSWWEGKYYGFEEGFLKIDIKNDDFSYEYIDYGWKVMNDE
ncbi:MAG: metallophosphoesterase [Bacteroidetes bacterium]|nr:metallophosphoesterase [Bacteroidota bacterium]